MIRQIIIEQVIKLSQEEKLMNANNGHMMVGVDILLMILKDNLVVQHGMILLIFISQFNVLNQQQLFLLMKLDINMKKMIQSNIMEEFIDVDNILMLVGVLQKLINQKLNKQEIQLGKMLLTILIILKKKLIKIMHKFKQKQFKIKLITIKNGKMTY